jgi:hypothetical protein
MQVRNARQRIKAFQVSTNGGQTWTSLQRKYYNFFELKHGTKTSTVDVRVQCIDGEWMQKNKVNVESNAETDMGVNC